MTGIFELDAARSDFAGILECGRYHIVVGEVLKKASPSN